MKKQFGIFIFLITSIIVLVIACSKHAQTDFIKTNTCDTSNVSYSKDVVPILQTNCYSCHGGSSNAGSGGIDLSTYPKLIVYATNGYLVGNVTWAKGYNPMPYGSTTKIDSCSINKIVAWVHKGTPNN